MKAISSATALNLFSLPAKNMRFFAVMMSFCVLINSSCPSSVIELKNYDVVVLAMGNQQVFLHLFALPSKAAIELANLLLNDKTRPSHGAAGGGNKAKASKTSSSDFSILCLDQTQKLIEFQLNLLHAVVFMTQAEVTSVAGALQIAWPVHQQGMLYFTFLLLFFSRPRGDTTNAAINPITNNTEPGLNLRPGFLFCEVSL